MVLNVLADASTRQRVDSRMKHVA